MALESVIEFHFPLEKLFDLVRHRLLEEDVCFPDFLDPLDEELSVLDHVSFPEGGALRFSGETVEIDLKPSGSVTVSPVQLLVPVQVFLKTKSCLEDPSCAPDAYKHGGPLTVNLVFTLTAEADRLCAHYVSIEFLNNPVPIEVWELGKLCTRMPLHALSPLLGTIPPVRNSMVSANSSLTLLAVRFELDESGTAPLPESHWLSFSTGGLAPGLDEKDWSLFLGSKLVEKGIERKYSQSIADSDKFTLKEGPSATWFPFGSQGAGAAIVTMSGDVDVDECVNDIGVAATIYTEFSVDANMPNQVKAHATLYTDLVDSDVFVCGLPFAGAGWVVNPWLGVIIMGAILIASGEVEPGEDQLSLPSECKASTENMEFDCTFPFNTPKIKLSSRKVAPSGTLVLDKMVGQPEGPVFGGSCSVPQVPEVVPIHVTSTGFTFGMNADCNTALQMGYDCTVKIIGTGRICGNGIEILDDPKHMFAVTPVKPNLYNGDPVAVWFPFSGDVWDPPSIKDYFDNPYPCRLKIVSSRGAQCFEIAPPPKPVGTPSEWSQQLQQAAIQLTNRCTKLQFPIRFLRIWLGDPPWELPASVIFEGEAAQATIFRVTDAHAELLTQNLVTREGHLLKSGLAVRLRVRGRFAARDAHQAEVQFDEVIPSELRAGINQAGKGVDLSAGRLRKTISVQKQLPPGVSKLSLDLDLSMDELLGPRLSFEGGMNQGPRG